MRASQGWGSLIKILHNAPSDDAAVAQLQALGVRVDYVETHAGRRFGAIVLPSGNGEVRLIDNCPPPQLVDVH